MQTEINTSTVVMLNLNIEEAMWLKGLMQNALLPEDAILEDEAPKDSAMRKRFWDALPDFDRSLSPADTPNAKKYFADEEVF